MRRLELLFLSILKAFTTYVEGIAGLIISRLYTLKKQWQANCTRVTQSGLASGQILLYVTHQTRPLSFSEDGAILQVRLVDCLRTLPVAPSQSLFFIQIVQISAARYWTGRRPIHQRRRIEAQVVAIALNLRARVQYLKGRCRRGGWRRRAPPHQ